MVLPSVAARHRSHMPFNDTDFEQIKWKEWIESIWIETVCAYFPHIFIRVKKHAHAGHAHEETRRGYNAMQTSYVEADDGFVYMLHRNHQTKQQELLPVYKTK